MDKFFGNCQTINAPRCCSISKGLTSQIAAILGLVSARQSGYGPGTSGFAASCKEQIDDKVSVVNIETFKNLLDAHGADIQSWPDPELHKVFEREPKVREELALALTIELELATRATQAPATQPAQILSNLPDQPKPPTLLWRELLSATHRSSVDTWPAP